MTGEGQTTPQGVDGMVIPAVVSALKYPNLPVTVTVGGIPRGGVRRSARD